MAELICIVCPRGCHLHVDEETLTVTGNSCARGGEYGKTEATNPVRVLTSVVRMEDGTHRCCSVKTNGGVPKKDIFQAMKALKEIRVIPPVKIGDVIVRDVCGTGVDWVATKAIPES